MNIFVAGIHGVGKTYLASKIPESFQLTHTSASKLIREERELPNWNENKKVGDIDGNQFALATAVKRHNAKGTKLLLDGHFVLKNSAGEFQPLESEVFETLNLKAVILIEATPEIIASRIKQRDDLPADLIHLEDFLRLERQQAEKVCEKLGIPLCILNAPSTDTFVKTVSKKIAKH